MRLFVDYFDEAKRIAHIHNWEYERHNSVMIRSCSCMTMEEGFIDEDPELISTAPMRHRDLNKIVWKSI
jgi:hypothetical protein